MRRIRPKLAWDPTYRTEHSWQLPPEAATGILECGSFRKEEEMLEEVREELSAYTSMARALDNTPRAAHKLAQLEQLIAEARAGRPELPDAMRGGEDQGLDWDLHLAGFPFDREVTSESLPDYLRATGKVRARLRREESRHGPTQKAREWLAFKLHDVFSRYYRRSSEDRRVVVEADFLKACFAAVGAPGLGFDPLRPWASRSRLVRLIHRVSKIRCACERCRPHARPGLAAGGEVVEKVEKIKGGYRHTVECPQCEMEYSYTTEEGPAPFDSRCPACGHRYDPAAPGRKKAPTSGSPKPRRRSLAGKRSLTGRR